MKTTKDKREARNQNRAEQFKINGKQLLRLLKLADKSTTLNSLTRLYVESERLKAQAAKLREKRKKIADEIKNATQPKAPEQFTFKF